MTNTFASKPIDSDRHIPVRHAEGPAEPPMQRSFRGVLRREHEEEGEHLRAALNADLESTHYTDEELEERVEIDRAQLSRIRTGKAHAPWKLVVWAADNSRLRPPAIVCAVCAVAEGEFKPKPPPSVEDRHAAMLDVLADMGIETVVREKVAKRLGVSP
jgi:hypothetical protein